MNDNLRLYRQVFDQLYGASTRSLFRTHIHSGSFALHVELEVHWLAFTTRTCLCNLYLCTLMLTGPGTEPTPPFFLMNSSKNRLQHLPSAGPPSGPGDGQKVPTSGRDQDHPDFAKTAVGNEREKRESRSARIIIV